MLSGQIVHRDVKGLNILLKEMRGYFETCICDFGAPSTSSFHGQRTGRRRACPAGVARVENLVDTVSKTGFKGTPAFMSPEQLEVDTCWVPQQLLREPWRSVGCAGCPRDDQVRRLCVRCDHVGDGFADASVARPRSYGGMRLSGWRVVAVCGIC
jgi:serine/threonine protein kinase